MTKKLHTEKEWMEGVERQSFSASKMLEGGKLTLTDLDEILPSAWHIADGTTLKLNFFSKGLCNKADRCANELLSLSVQEYLNLMVHPKSRGTILSKVDELQQSQNNIGTVSYFQQGHFQTQQEYELFFTTKKFLPKSNEFFTLVHATKQLGLIANKLEHLLEENYFLKNHFKQFSTLTKQETEVLKMIVLGMKRKHIAEQLTISVHTYDTHRKRIREKLEAKSFADLLRYAEAFGLV